MPTSTAESVSRAPLTSRHTLEELFHDEIGRLSAVPLRGYVRQVLRQSERAITVDAVAGELGVTRQHLARLCRHSRLQETPQWYLSVARLLAAAERLQHGNVRARRVALELRFGEASDLYTMFARYTRQTVPALRDRGMFEYMTALYRTALTPAEQKSSDEVTEVPTR